MASPIDTAPTFTATRGTYEHETYDLADDLGDGPVVLAFFPGAFTPPCTNEMVALQDDLERIEDAGATVVGVSADSAFSLAAFSEEHGIEFDLVSDMGRGAIEQYDLRMDIPELGLYGGRQPGRVRGRRRSVDTVPMDRRRPHARTGLRRVDRGGRGGLRDDGSH